MAGGRALHCFSQTTELADCIALVPALHYHPSVFTFCRWPGLHGRPVHSLLPPCIATLTGNAHRMRTPRYHEQARPAAPARCSGKASMPYQPVKARLTPQEAGLWQQAVQGVAHTHVHAPKGQPLTWHLPPGLQDLFRSLVCCPPYAAGARRVNEMRSSSSGSSIHVGIARQAHGTAQALSLEPGSLPAACLPAAAPSAAGSGINALGRCLTPASAEPPRGAPSHPARLSPAR